MKSIRKLDLAIVIIFSFAICSYGVGGLTHLRTKNPSDPHTIAVADDLTISGKIGRTVAVLSTTTVAGMLVMESSASITGGLKYLDGNQGLNKVLTSDASGNATWQPTAGGLSIVDVSSVSADAVTDTTLTVTCTGGKVLLMGGCQTSPSTTVTQFFKSAADAWTCVTNVVTQITATATCY